MIKRLLLNLFDAMKHPNDQNVCSKVENVENEVALMARAKVLLLDRMASE